MKDPKKIVKAIIFPNIAIVLILIPTSIVFLVLSMLNFGTESPIAIISYALSAYTLTICCFRIPNMISSFKNFKENNKYAKRWFSDTHFRINILLYFSLSFNLAYAVFQLFLGIYHTSFWYYGMAGYFISLAIMRFFLFRHTKRHKAGENIYKELTRYRTCGWIFLAMNLTLSVMILFMIKYEQSFVHHEITTITMAAYTFTTFTFAIINIVKYRKYQSPVYSASKAISLAAASVSMIILTSTMLTSFGSGNEETFRRIILSALGAAVSVLLTTMAVYMIFVSTKKIKGLTNE